MSHKITDIEKTLPPVTGSHVSSPIVTNRVLSEHADFKNKTEENPAVYPNLKKYWNYTVPNWSDWSPTGTPWSAAYISWILKPTGFPPHAGHSFYTERVINKEGQDKNWTAYSIPKTDNLQLHVGDVLIKPRAGSYTTSHGDVVYQIKDGYALLSGGNVSNSAKLMKSYRVDEDGFVLDRITDYKIILKKKGSANRLVIPLLVGGLAYFIFLRRAK